MKTKYNFKIIIKKDQRTGSNETCYSSYVPGLGLSADGDTVNDAIKNTEKLIKFHISCLLEEGDKIVDDSKSETIIYDSNIEIKNA